MNEPYLFALGIPSHHAVDYRRLTGLSMRIVFTNCINFDVLRIVHGDKFLVNIGTVGTRMVQSGIDFA